jgi:hypothetical protein
MANQKKRVHLAVTLEDGRMPALAGKVAKMPEEGDVLWKDGSTAYLVSNMKKTRKELFLTLEVVAAA